MAAPIRVLYVDHVARLSGGELALSRLLEALGDRVRPYVVLAEDGPLVELLRERGIEVEVLPLGDGVREVRRDAVARAAFSPAQLIAGARYVWRLSKVIRAVEPDLVHTNSLKAGVYGSAAARLARVPCLWHVRDRIAADYLPQPTVMALRGLIRWMPDAVIANSHATLRTLRAPRGEAFVLYNVLPEIAQAPSERAPRPHGSFRVGIVGRVSAWKGHDVFLRAFAEAFADVADARAVVVGAPLFDGDDIGDELRALASELGIAERVDWRGFREHVMEEMAALDVLVHASVVPEPFGQVVLEGLAAGVPVVATRDGGPGEILQDRVNGRLYEAGNASELADVLRELHQDEEMRRRLAAAGRIRAGDFSPEAVSAQMLRAYSGLLRAA